MGDCALRSAFDRLRHLGDVFRPESGCRQRAHAGNRGGGGRRRAGLSQAPVHDDRHRRRRDFRAAGLLPRHAGCDRLPDRCGAVGRCGLHRHERLGSRQRAHRAGRDHLAGRRSRTRLQGGRDHGHARCRSRAARRHHLFRLSHPRHGAEGQRPRRRRCAGGARLRRLADLDLRPSRRRHLHQGRRRRRRSRRQGRSRHSRGRSAQPGDHRRQRRRQRR